MMKSAQRHHAGLLAFGAAFGFLSPAFAQTSTPPVDAMSDAMSDEAAGEIVVTAQKRPETVQSVPISISAFGKETLATANVGTVLDLGRIASGIQSVQSSSTAATRINIRGVGAFGNTLIEPSVATFIDGIYVPRAGSMVNTFLDMEGVEVLRGPQGTLFGRNASVGALSLRTATPKDEFSGEITGEVGSFQRLMATGHVNIPLNDNVAVRLAGQRLWSRGPWYNTYDGRYYGGSDDYALRASLKAELGNLEWLLRGDFARMNGDGVSNIDLDPSSISPARLDFLKANFGGGPDTNLEDRIMNTNPVSGLLDKNWGFSSTATLHVGEYIIKMINSHRQWSNDQQDDLIIIPTSILSRRSQFNSNSENHEIQFITPEKGLINGLLDSVFGIYYFSEDFSLTQAFNMGNEFCNTLVPSGQNRINCQNYYSENSGINSSVLNVFQNVKSFAVYNQTNVYFADKWTLTLGGRWTHEKKSGTFDQMSSPFTAAIRAPEALILPDLSESRFTYKIGLNYKPTSDLMIFASFSTGYKSGGYNSGGGRAPLSEFDGAGNLISTKRVFQRETVKNYELGFKSSWLDRALKFNMILYRMDIAGFQDRAFDGVSILIRNAGSLRQQGAEVDLTVAPTWNLSITGSLAYLDSEFTSFKGASNLPGLPGTQDMTRKPNVYSPKWMGNIGVNWRGDLGSSGLGYKLSTNVNFVSRQYVGSVTDGNPQTLADAYALVGARLTIHGWNERWSISVFGQNLTNNHYRSIELYQPLAGAFGLNNNIFPGSSANRIFASLPRTFGVSGTVKF